MREVDIVEIEEEVVGEAAHLAPYVHAHGEAGARDEARVVRVPGQLRDGLVEPADPAEPEVVRLAARRVHALAPGQRDDPHPGRVRGRRAPQRLEAAGRGDGVGVQEQQDVAGRRPRAEVDRRGEPQIAGTVDHAVDLGVATDPRGAARGRLVVDHDHLVAGGSLGADLGEQAREVLAVANDHDRQLHERRQG